MSQAARSHDEAKIYTFSTTFFLYKKFLKQANFPFCFQLQFQEAILQPKNISLAKPTDFRLDEDYVIWYVNVAHLLVQGIISFVILRKR